MIATTDSSLKHILLAVAVVLGVGLTALLVAAIASAGNSGGGDDGGPPDPPNVSLMKIPFSFGR